MNQEPIDKEKQAQDYQQKFQMGSIVLPPNFDEWYKEVEKRLNELENKLKERDKQITYKELSGE